MFFKTVLETCFLKLFLRTVFKKTILVFFENCSCSLNLVFSVLSMFFRTKKKKKTRNQMYWACLVPVFENYS